MTDGFKTWRRFRQYKRGEHYVVGADTGAGGGDYCAAHFLCKTTLDVPVVYHSPLSATAMTPELHRELEYIFDMTGVKPTVAYERQNGGSFEMERLATLNRLGKYEIFVMPNAGSTENAEGRKLGWDTNTATRPMMLSELADAIRSRSIMLYDRMTVGEMFSFVVNRTSNSWKAQAEAGAHDDLIMSLAITWQLYKLVPTPPTEEDLEIYTPDWL